ncbi:MAG TPA: DUF6266 family protein [Prolixibacteraceae bacterium]|jgi:hypothetical protein
MAIITKSILGGISGKVGKFVYSSWKGKPYVRSAAEHITNPMTQGQLEQRARFTLILRFLRPLTLFLREGFYRKQGSISPFNSAMSYHLKNAVAGTYPDYRIDYSKVLVSRGNLPGASNPAARLSPAGEIEFTWENNSIDSDAMPDDRALLLVYNSNKQEVVSIVGGNLRVNGSQLVALPSTFEGDELHCYIAFQNVYKLIVSDSQYLGRIRISRI